MKRLVTFLFLVSIGYQVCAQKAIFVRVFNLNGKKINTGRVLATTDTSLQLKTESRDTVNLSINSIGTIKTKRSAGHNVLMGSVAAAGAFAIFGAATAGRRETNLRQSLHADSAYPRAVPWFCPQIERTRVQIDHHASTGRGRGR